MKRSLTIVLLVLPILLVACGNGGSSESSSEDFAAARDGMAEIAIEQNSSNTIVENVVEDVDLNSRLVAYEAQLSVVVKGIEEKITNIQQEVSALGGYIVESSLYAAEEGRKNATVVVKVPQARFEEFLTYIESQSETVNDRNVHGQDVTEEFVDIEARLKAKKVVEARLLTFMDNAKTTEDLLKISVELGKVQEQIEQFEGKLNYLRNRTNYASVTIYIQDSEILIPAISREHTNTWDQAKKTFIDTINGLKGIGSALIVFFIGFSPLWIIAGATFIIIWYLLKRKKNNNHKE